MKQSFVFYISGKGAITLVQGWPIPVLPISQFPCSDTPNKPDN